MGCRHALAWSRSLGLAGRARGDKGGAGVSSASSATNPAPTVGQKVHGRRASAESLRGATQNAPCPTFYGRLRAGRATPVIASQPLVHVPRGAASAPPTSGCGGRRRATPLQPSTFARMSRGCAVVSHPNPPPKGASHLLASAGQATGAEGLDGTPNPARGTRALLGPGPRPSHNQCGRGNSHRLQETEMRHPANLTAAPVHLGRKPVLELFAERFSLPRRPGIRASQL